MSTITSTLAIRVDDAGFASKLKAVAAAEARAKAERSRIFEAAVAAQATFREMVEGTLPEMSANR